MNQIKWSSHKNQNIAIHQGVHWSGNPYDFDIWITQEVIKLTTEQGPINNSIVNSRMHRFCQAISDYYYSNEDYINQYITLIMSSNSEHRFEIATPYPNNLHIALQTVYLLGEYNEKIHTKHADYI